MQYNFFSSRRCLILLVGMVVILTAEAWAAPKPLTLAGPNGRIQFQLYLQEGNRLSSRVAWRSGATVIEPSPLGMILDGNDLVHSVASPPDRGLFPQGIKTEWIRPGRAVWKYLDGGENTLEEMRVFSRLAGELGFEYNLIEDFWQKWSAAELKEFVEFSRRQGVGIWLWKHSKDLRDAESRRRFFQTCQEAGVVGAKIDFFDHEAKEEVELYAAHPANILNNQVLRDSTHVE